MKMFIIIAYTIFIPLAVRFNNYDIENIKKAAHKILCK